MPNGKMPEKGEVFKNPYLANTLEKIAKGGRDAFYKGDIARTIEKYMKENGGFLSYEDLVAHHSEWVSPVSSNYRGYDVWELPPNGQGIATLQILNILEGFDIKSMVRGKAVSRPLDSILDDVRQTVANGFKELVITGVNIGRYDHNGLTFEDVLQQILDVPGDFRVRISSLEPDGLSPRFAELFSHPKMCPHLHLCLQSGSERILLEMRRMYSATQFRQTVQKIQNQFPHFNFTTDVIMGFPGETEQDFEDTANMLMLI